MKYRTYNRDGVLIEEGVIGPGFEPNIETHGSISVEVYLGRWINLLTSEWLVCSYSDQPKTWKDQ